MLIIYFLCVLLPIVTVSMFYYSITRDKVASQKEQDSIYLLESATKSLQEYFNDGIICGEYINANDVVYKLLTTTEGDMQTFIDVAKTLDSIVNTACVYSSVDNITIYCDAPALYRCSSIRKIDDNIKKKNWFQDFLKSGQKYFVYVNTTYNANDDEYPGDINILLNYKATKNIDNQFLLKIDIKRSKIVSILRNHVPNSEMLLLDSEDNIIASSNYEYISGIEKFQKTSDLYDDNQYNIIYRPLEFPNDFKVAVCFQKFTISDMLNHETVSFIIILFLDIIFASLTIFIISKQLTTRINKISIATKRMREQEFELIDDKDAGRDEIGDLVYGMNRTVSKIKQLIKEVYVERIKNSKIEEEKQKAKLNALQSQINPHFIFNILEVIRMNSIVKNEFETADNIANISKMLRKVITWGEDIISIEDEMVFVNAYLELQRYRLGEECHIEICLDNDVVFCKIPKMAIQVFVENSFVHGLIDSNADKILKIYARKSSDRIEIKIYDNGVGISRDKLAEINNYLEKRDLAAKKSIGIKNIIERFSMYYDKDFKLDIKSEYGVYTEVTIELPDKVCYDKQGGGANTC